MKAVILAAGMGRRLGEAGSRQPKCLLPCPGGTLLRNALDSLADSKVDEVVVATGFQEALIRAAVAEGPLSCRFVHNPDFATTNTLYSVYLARSCLVGGFVLLNGDVWFQPRVIDRLLKADVGGRLAVQVKSCGQEEVKVILGQEDRILQIGKRIRPEVAAGEYIGVGAFSDSIAPAFCEALVRHAESPAGQGLYVESAMNDLVAANSLSAVRIGTDEAIEIDTPEDYAAAKALWRKLGLRLDPERLNTEGS